MAPRMVLEIDERILCELAQIVCVVPGKAPADKDGERDAPRDEEIGNTAIEGHALRGLARIESQRHDLLAGCEPDDDAGWWRRRWGTRRGRRRRRASRIRHGLGGARDRSTHQR